MSYRHLPAKRQSAKRLAVKSLIAAATCSAIPALPQAVAAQERVLEEVIVTARRREETLQETPVAVTALSAGALRDAGVRNLKDLNGVAPNIDVHEANGTAPLANIYIRGVGQRNTEVNIDSGVGIYVDEVYIGRPDGALLDLNDIQSVQVLRGPQGTLFGKNTTGGALVFTTNRPEEEFEGSLEARVGNYDRLDIAGVLNVPLTDTLWSRWSVTSVNRDGYVDNKFLDKEYLDEERINAMGQFRWLPADALTIDLNLNYTDTDQTTRPQKCRLVPGVVGWQAALFDVLGGVPSTGRTLDDFCQDNIDAGDALDVISDLDGQYEAETWGASVTAEWEVSGNLSFKSARTTISIIPLCPGCTAPSSRTPSATSGTPISIVRSSSSSAARWMSGCSTWRVCSISRRKPTGSSRWRFSGPTIPGLQASSCSIRVPSPGRSTTRPGPRLRNWNGLGPIAGAPS